MAFSLSTTSICHLREIQIEDESNLIQISIPDLGLKESFDIDQLQRLYTDENLPKLDGKGSSGWILMLAFKGLFFSRISKKSTMYIE